MAAEDWKRPHFAPGGGNAFLFFAAFGEFSSGMNVEKRHRSRGLPAACEVRSFSREKYADRFGAFLDNHLGKVLADLGASVDRAVRAAPQMLLIRGEVPDPRDLGYLRDTIGVVAALFESGAIAVVDATAFQWWTAESWTRDLFGPDKPRPGRLVTILKSEEPPGSGKWWFHTRGLRKFGRPDVGVYGAPESAEEAVGDLCERFIEMQALGAIVPDGEPVRMASLPPGMFCRTAGSLEDPDYNNTHLEIHWPKNL